MDVTNCYAKVYRDGTYVFYTGARGGNVEKAREKQRVTSRVYRVRRSILRSATLELWKKRVSRTQLFVTVTCPTDCTEAEAARAWGLWLKNMETNRRLRRYVWVKERQQSGRLHYHIIIDLPYVSVWFMQKAWETAYRSATGVVHTTHNSVRLGDRPVVGNSSQVARYLVKYVAKSVGTFTRRAYGYSTTLTQGMTGYVCAMSLYRFMEKYPSAVFVSEPYLIVGRVDKTCIDRFSSWIDREFLPDG